MAQVVGKVKDGEFVVTEYKTAKKTVENPKAIDGGPISLPLDGGNVDFTDVMKTMRTKVEPLKVAFVGWLPAEKEVKKGAVRDPKLRNMIIKVGDNNEEVWVKAKVVGVGNKDIEIQEIIGVRNGESNTMKLDTPIVLPGIADRLVVTAQAQFYTPSQQLELAKTREVVRDAFGDSKPFQKALVDFSARKKGYTLASAEKQNFTNDDLMNLVADMKNGKKPSDKGMDIV